MNPVVEDCTVKKTPTLHSLKPKQTLTVYASCPICSQVICQLYGKDI